MSFKTKISPIAWMSVYFALICFLIAIFIGPVQALYTFAISNFFQILYIIALEKYGVSILIHKTVLLIYFSLAPALQIQSGATFWGHQGPSIDQLTHAMAMVFLYDVGFCSFIMNKNNEKPLEDKLKKSSILDNHFFRIIASQFLAISLAVIIIAINPAPSLSDRGDYMAVNDMTPLQFIIFAVIPKTLLYSGFIVLIYYLFNYKLKNFMHYIILATLSIAYVPLIYLLAGPKNTPRQLIYMGMMPIVFFVFRGKFKQKIVVFFLTVFGFIVLASLVNLISRDVYNNVSSDTFPLSPDFDVMFNLSTVPDDAYRGALGLGRYTLNAFSFVLPKDLKLFPDFDPLTSESIRYYYSQRNISFPSFATGYMDLGFFGCYLYGALVSIVLKFCSNNMYYQRKIGDQRLKLVSAVAIFCYVPFTRGAIQGMGPYLFMMIVCTYFISTVSGLSRVRVEDNFR